MSADDYRTLRKRMISTRERLSKFIKPPTHSLAHIFNKKPPGNENFVSYWLAFLLNAPVFGSNEPLRALLRLAGIKLPKKFASTDISFTRERKFQNKKRIDFFIDMPDFIIGIENKIGTTAGQNQLEDYSDSLIDISRKKMKKKSPILYYLTPENAKGTIDDFKDLNSHLSTKPKQDHHDQVQALHITYGQLWKEFDKTEKTITANIQNYAGSSKYLQEKLERSLFYLKEFQEYVKEYIV